MEDDLKECHKKGCKRRGILIQTNARYCLACGAKLKGPTWRSKDQPPLIEGDTLLARFESEGDQMHQTINSNDHSGYILTQPEWIDKGNKPWTYWTYLRSHNIEGWAEFKGGFDAYNEYLLKMGVGDGKKRCATNAIIVYQSQQGAPTAKPSDEFTCDSDVEGCPILDKALKARIEVPNVMHRAWIYLCKAFSTEWIAYLKGHRREDGVYEITDMYFPKQRANGAHVDAEDGEVEEGTIGAIHSHVDMGAFFSKEDKEHANHEIELVINRRGEMATAVRHQLECGRHTRISAGVYLIGDPNEQALVAALSSKLTDEKVTSSSTSTSASTTHSTTTEDICNCVCSDCKEGKHPLCKSSACRTYRYTSAKPNGQATMGFTPPAKDDPARGPYLGE